MASKAACEWIKDGSDYFGGWYRLRHYQMMESTLEADWYGLWNTVLSLMVNSIELPVDQYLELHPQISITQAKWSEDPLVGESASYAPIRRTRTHRDDEQVSIEDGIASLSLVSPSVLAIDDISAAFTDISSASQAAGQQSSSKDKERRPDWAVTMGYSPGFLEPEECLFSNDSSGHFRSQLPYLRILLLVEVKRLPPSGPEEPRSEYEERISRTLDHEMRKQVYDQVRFTFAQYRMQHTLVHLSAVGDYCKIRWFSRKRMEKNGLLSGANEGLTPRWKDITVSTDVQLLRLVRPGTKTVNPLIKSALTKIRKQQLSSMYEEHSRRSARTD